jgi:dTDP-4-amino-4,6-dideoxygalactose transaminase
MHYKPNHLLSYYGAGRERLPHAEQLATEVLTLPYHPGLSYEEQDYVVRCLKDALDR